MKVKIIIALLLWINNISANMATVPEFSPNSLQGNVSGRIIDQTSNTPMEYVTVVLYSSTDSSMVSGTITDFEGKFLISGLDAGNYYVEASFLGFEKKHIEGLEINQSNTKLSLGDISMEPVNTAIDEVTVKGERAKVEYQIDKRIVNVDKNINAQGGTAIDALENTPSVQVDGQGNLTLRGSSDYIVLIDGKPSVIKGSDALKQLPASSIKQIEVITNPSAKYDVDGQAGIINVVLKKDKLQGLSGNASISGSTNDKTNGNLLVNYRKGKLNYFLGVDYADNIYRTDIDINNLTYNPDGDLHIVEDVKQFHSNDNMALRGGFDFDFNEKNSFSFSGRISRQGYDNGNDANYHRWDNQTNAYYTSSNYMDITGDAVSFTGDYRYTIKENNTLSVSAYYGSWKGVDNNLLKEANADEFYNEQALASQLNFIKDNSNYQIRTNIDYSQPIKEGKFEVGFQYRYESRFENLEFMDYDIQGGSWVQNNDYSYKQDYMNAIYSGYATFSGKKAGINYQIGARSEFFARDIAINSDDKPLNFNKFMIYPSVHFSKEMNEKNQFQLSYGRRINRPQPWLLNNTPSYIDPYNIFMGDPNLKFEYIDAFEFNYRVVLKKVTLSTQTYYRYTTNAFTALRLMNNEGIMVHQLTNADNQAAYGIEENVNIDLFKWWQINTNVNVYHYSLETLVKDSEKKQEVNTWNANINSNFSIGKGTRLQAMVYYQSKGVDAMGETTGAYTCNLGINQSFMKGKMKVGLNAQNIFNSLKFDYKVKTNQFDNIYKIQNEGPIFIANISYTFNNFQQKNRGRADDINFKGGGGF